MEDVCKSGQNWTLEGYVKSGRLSKPSQCGDCQGLRLFLSMIEKEYHNSFDLSEKNYIALIIPPCQGRPKSTGIVVSFYSVSDSPCFAMWWTLQTEQKTVSLFCLFSKKVSRKDKYTGYFYLSCLQAGCGFLKILNTHLLIKEFVWILPAQTFQNWMLLFLTPRHI